MKQDWRCESWISGVDVQQLAPLFSDFGQPVEPCGHRQGDSTGRPEDNTNSVQYLVNSPTYRNSSSKKPGPQSNFESRELDELYLILQRRMYYLLYMTSVAL